MRLKFAVIAVAVLIAGCSNAPSDSEIKAAIVDTAGSAPNDLSCSENKDATAARRQRMEQPQNNLAEVNAINGVTRSDPDHTWVMDCQVNANGTSTTVRMTAGRGSDGKLRVSM
ncbi:MAG TPA: hypothetical protein VFA81_07735 [Burkholderiales bacterium]|nr:hypothetical protein [Burkholderiales bacterium]